MGRAVSDKKSNVKMRAKWERTVERKAVPMEGIRSIELNDNA